MKITKMTASKHVAERYYCELEDATTLRVNTALIADFSLYSGRELDDEELAKLRAASDLYTAREKALRLAGSRAMSRRELEKKLTDKGIGGASAAETVDWMERIGAIDDTEYAGMIVRHYAAAGYGLGRIREELFRRGVPKELWDGALEQMPAADSRLDALVASKLRGVSRDDEKRIKKLTDMLQRRGFSWDEIRGALARYAFEMDGYEEN